MAAVRWWVGPESPESLFIHVCLTSTPERLKTAEASRAFLSVVTLYHGSFRVGRLFTWWFRALNTYIPKEKRPGRSSVQYLIQRQSQKSTQVQREETQTLPN